MSDIDYGTPTAPVPSGAWVSVSEADAYFETRYGASALWTSGVDKTAVLVTAQQDLENCSDYGFDAVTEDAPATTAMIHAVCEQAMFRLIDPDIETRAALRAQGVTRADIVGETYGACTGFPVCARAKVLLRTYARGDSDFIPLQS